MQKQAMLDCIRRVWGYANQESQRELNDLCREIEACTGDLTPLAFDLDDAIDRVLISLEV